MMLSKVILGAPTDDESHQANQPRGGLVANQSLRPSNQTGGGQPDAKQNCEDPDGMMTHLKAKSYRSAAAGLWRWCSGQWERRAHMQLDAPVCTEYQCGARRNSTPDV